MSESAQQPAILAPHAVEDVFSATEQVRAADFPAVPSDLLADILKAERDNLEDRVAANRAVGRAVDAWLEKHPESAEANVGPADRGA
jgi:hypothetical protein